MGREERPPSSIRRGSWPRAGARLGLAPTLAIAIALAAPTAAMAVRSVVATNGGSAALPVDTVASLTASDLTGSLTPVTGSPFPAGDEPNGVAITPDGRFAYAANRRGDNVSGFGLAADGTLTPAAGSPTASGGEDPTGVAVTPNGNFLLVVNRDVTAPLTPSVAVFAIDQSDGSIAQVSGSPFAMPAGVEDPTGIAITPDGRFAYVIGSTTTPPGLAGRVAAYAIDADGALTNVAGSPFNTGGLQSFAAGVRPQGDRLFVSSVRLGASSISVLDIDGATGAVAPVTGSPFAVSDAPIGIEVSPTGNRLAVSHSTNPRQLRLYSIAADGSIALTDNVDFGSAGPEMPTFSADERFVYTTVSAGMDPAFVAGFEVNADGTLTPLPGSPYGTGDQAPQFFSIAATPSQAPVAEFTHDSAVVGQPTQLTSTSSVRGGRVARYDWAFGDGTTLPDGPPNPTHIYEAVGTYQVALTVTNDCAITPPVGTTLFAGQTAYCNGNSVDSVEQQVTISKAGRSVSLDANKGKVRKGRKVRLSGEVDAPQNETQCESNQRVKLQRKGKKKPDSAFKTFAKDETDAGGGFAFKVKVKKTRVYRARVSTTDACEKGTSNNKKVRVKRPK